MFVSLADLNPTPSLFAFVFVSLGPVSICFSALQDLVVQWTLGLIIQEIDDVHNLGE